MKSALERSTEVAQGIIREHAVRVDAEGVFPVESIGAMREAGLLGLTSAKEVGGEGASPAEAAAVLEQVARECGSSGMILCMHYCGAAVIEKHGPEAVRQEVAAGRHLTTLAFSEAGSRSQFWAPISTAERREGAVALNARKSWVTTARHADSFVWSSRPLEGEGASTIWLVPRETPGLRMEGRFDGLGFRGNDSIPVVAEDALISEENRLGPDGEGMQVMLGDVLPVFSLYLSSVNVGLMEGATSKATEHVSGTKYEHSGASLAGLPTVRAYLARMRIATDQARLIVQDTAAAIEAAREDAVLRVLECKAAVGESATSTLDLAMRVCGGMAFRKEVGVERHFRDGRAGTVMAPTTDQLYDFIGKALCGLPLF
jgi:alkylation response protein AidB-like acyl-CoA dehydrogenase